MRRLLAATICLVAATGIARADLQPGEYEITTTMAVPGMPQPQSNTQTQCMTAEEAKDPAGHMISDMANDGDCKVGKHSGDASHVVVDFDCTLQGHKSSGHMDMTFADTTMDGTIAMKVEVSPGQTQTMTTTVKAARKGNCS